MGARGRKSSAELALVPRVGVEVMRRPEPPASLSEEAASEWREIVASLPPDHFPRSIHPVLEAYCLHTVARRAIDGLIQRLGEDATLADYNRLLDAHGRESRALAGLAVRLGIAKATHISGTPAKAGPRPYE